MLTFIARRLIATIPVIAMVGLFVFLMLRLTPGDPAAIIAGDSANAQQVEDIREKLGLNQPLGEQFVIWVGKMAQGDFGESFFFKKTVAELIAQRIEPTLALALATIVIAVLVAVPLGVLAAWKHGSWIDRVVMGFSVLGFSVPVFVVGYMLIYVFSLVLGWLPVQGYTRIGDGLLPFLERLILPSITLSVIYVALIARISRTSVLEVLGEDYIRTARAKGLVPRIIIGRHALRNALLPAITVIGLEFAFLFGGLVVTEQVFNLNGLGKLFVQAVANRDFIMIQGMVMLFAVIYIFANLVVDLLYAVFDPRIRYGTAEA